MTPPQGKPNHIIHSSTFLTEVKGIPQYLKTLYQQTVPHNKFYMIAYGRYKYAYMPSFSQNTSFSKWTICFLHASEEARGLLIWGT